SGSADGRDPRREEVLNPFEGTGLDTSWTLELDRDASPGWWDAISDVVIAIDGLAGFSEAARQIAQPRPPRRFVLISGARFGGGAVSTIRSTGKGTMQLDLRHFPFAAAEKNRRVTNAIVLLPGAGAGTVKGHVHLMSPAVDKAFPI